MKLKGTNVVVVGGSSGIGFATAKLAQHEGASVTIAGRSEEKLAQAQSQLSDVQTVVADITDAASVERVFEKLDRIDHVFITAGSLVSGKIVDADLSTLRRVVDERIWASIYIVRHASSTAAALPGKRIGTPEEVAEAVVTLMTNGFINAEVLHIDGGGRYV